MAQDPIDQQLICLPPGEAISRKFYRGLKELRMDWPTSVEASSMGLITRYVANGYGIGVSVNLPELVQHPKVKVIPLPGFEPVEVGVLWRPPVNAIHDAIRKIIETRARVLWPTTGRRGP